MFLAFLLFTKEIVFKMKEAKYGTIVNIGSTAALKGYSGGSIYSSSKFALRCLTQCWQSELRPFNIRVCQLNPSEVTTAFGSVKRIERDEEKINLHHVKLHTLSHRCWKWMIGVLSMNLMFGQQTRLIKKLQ